MKNIIYVALISGSTLIYTGCTDSSNKKKDDKYRYEESNEVNSNAFEFKKLVSIDQAISFAKSNNLSIFIYIGGINSVSSRKFEEFVEEDEEVQLILSEKFVSFKGYVDDTTPIGEGNITMGDRIFDIKKELCNNRGEPCFVTLDKSGSKISEHNTFSDRNEFIDFLLGHTKKES